MFALPAQLARVRISGLRWTFERSPENSRGQPLTSPPQKKKSSPSTSPAPTLLINFSQKLATKVLGWEIISAAASTGSNLSFPLRQKSGIKFVLYHHYHLPFASLATWTYLLFSGTHNLSRSFLMFGMPCHVKIHPGGNLIKVGIKDLLVRCNQNVFF